MKQFDKKTVIMIAHRLDTAVIADKVLVMDEGKVVEYDSPFKLMAQNVSDEEITKEGLFVDMVQACGAEKQKQLFAEARRKFMQ